MVDHLDDLESDFSAIHHLHVDIEGGEFAGLTSRRFFALAERLPAYPGVLQARVMAEQQRESGTPVVGTAPVTDEAAGASAEAYREAAATSARLSANGDSVKVIPLTPGLAAGGMAALGLGGLVDYSTSG